MCEAEKWLIENESNLSEEFLEEILSYTHKYMSRNDEYTFEEAFESVDSVVYGMWRDSK